MDVWGKSLRPRSLLKVWRDAFIYTQQALITIVLMLYPTVVSVPPVDEARGNDNTELSRESIN